MSNELSDNEKAASFIGWKHDKLCNGCEIKQMLTTGGGSFSYFEHAQHYIDAPDMSRPENYMKALEGPHVRTWGHAPEGMWVVQGSEGESGEGNTPVEALADLYDALKGRTNAIQS